MRTVKTEFPDYDGVLPHIAGYEDSSWHNDACPSIEKNYGTGVRVRIWCDYADPERRESNGYTRFGVVAYSPTDENGSDMLSTDSFHLVIERVAQFEASMTIPPLDLAKAFCRQLRIELELYKELADETLGIINARNAEFEAKGNHSTCATHDFCDANQVMLDAIESICGFADYHFAQNEMINAAWNIARKARFDADKCCEPVKDQSPTDAILAACVAAESWLSEYETGPDTGLQGLLSQLRSAISSYRRSGPMGTDPLPLG